MALKISEKNLRGPGQRIFIQILMMLESELLIPVD